MGTASVEEASKLVAGAPRCASANFLLAQHTKTGPEALDLEWTPKAVARIPLRKGFLVHTNHFKDAALAPGCEIGQGPSTRNRNRVATDLARRLRDEVSDPVDRMKRILSSTRGAPYSISQMGGPGSSSKTLAGIVMDLGRNRLVVAAGPPHESPWVRLPGV
jgi:hypothetical protein